MYINLIEYFQKTVMTESSRVAVIDGERNICYNSLDRKAIGASLPKYMIPFKYVWLQGLNRNPNGKIDRLYYNNIANEQ